MSSYIDDVYRLSHADHLGSLPQLVHILCGPSQTALKVIQRILESSPFRHEYYRQHANTDNGMVMCLPDDNAGAVTRLLVYTHGTCHYRKYRRELNAEDIVEDYLLANKYGAQCVKQDIIRFLKSIGRGGFGDYSRWLDFATKVYQGLGERDVHFQKYFKVNFYDFWSSTLPTLEPTLDLDTDGFKCLMFKGGYLAMDVFDVYERVRAMHERFLDLRKKDEKDAEEEQRN